MKKSKPNKPPSEEYQRFEKLAKQLISVPKSEIDKREAEYQKQKKGHEETEDCMTKSDDVHLTHDQVAFGALVGVNVIAVVELLGLSQLDNSLRVALYCFAISIPLLCAYLININFANSYEHLTSCWYNVGAMAVGSLASIAGMASIFWHFSSTLGLLFVILCSFGIIFVVAFPDKERR